MGTKSYCIENDRAAQMELAEMERHNSLLIWEENKQLRSRVARLEEALRRIAYADMWTLEKDGSDAGEHFQEVATRALEEK